MSSPCRYFLEGRCRFGDACRYAHNTNMDGRQDVDAALVVSRQVGGRRMRSRRPSTTSRRQMRVPGLHVDELMHMLAIASYLHSGEESSTDEEYEGEDEVDVGPANPAVVGCLPTYFVKAPQGQPGNNMRIFEITTQGTPAEYRPIIFDTELSAVLGSALVRDLPTGFNPSSFSVGSENCGVECAICLKNISYLEVVSELPCKHILHCDCVRIWFETHNSCPLCRSELPRSLDVTPRRVVVGSDVMKDVLDPIMFKGARAIISGTSLSGNFNLDVKKDMNNKIHFLSMPQKRFEDRVSSISAIVIRIFLPKQDERPPYKMVHSFSKEPTAVNNEKKKKKKDKLIWTRLSKEENVFAQCDMGESEVERRCFYC